MAFNIGINVLEVEGKSAPAIAGAPTSVAGFITRTRRGPIGEVVRVSNFQQFLQRFGGYHSDRMGAYCVKGFFDNGGREAYITRVEEAGATAATVVLPESTGTVTAGCRSKKDPGEWGNDIYLQFRRNPSFQTQPVPMDENGESGTLSSRNTPAVLIANESKPQVDFSELIQPRVLTLSVQHQDESESERISVDLSKLSTPSSLEDVVRAINRKVGQRAVASITSSDGSNDKKLTIRTKSKGENASIRIKAEEDTLLGYLGFTNGTLEINGSSGSSSSERIEVEYFSGLKEGDYLYLSDPLTEDNYQIEKLEILTDNDSGKKRYYITLAEVDNEYLAHETTLRTGEFDLAVLYPPTSKAKPQSVESWEGLTLTPNRSNSIESQLNDPIRGSAYICVDIDDAPGKLPPDDVIIRLGVPGDSMGQLDSTATWTRESGLDGTSVLPSAYEAALPLFDTIPIQLLAAPDLEDLSNTLGAFIDYCENDKGDCIFVGHTPPKCNADNALQFGASQRRSKAYGALYWPWIQVNDPVGLGAVPTKWIPPVGHIMGVYARIDQTRGVWKAPAGNEAVLRGALAVETEISDRDHTALVKQGSVNGIRRIVGAGIVIDSSRTLSTDPRWLYVNVRLLFNYVKASLRESLRWVKQEPNREKLWNTIKYNTVTPFLQRLYQAGAFGPGAPEDVYTIVCGPENNPPDQIQLGNLKVEIYFYPARPAETIIITVGQQDGGSSSSEQ